MQPIEILGNFKLKVYRIKFPEH